jgi:hypothetical protein
MEIDLSHDLIEQIGAKLKPNPHIQERRARERRAADVSRGRVGSVLELKTRSSREISSTLDLFS